MSELKTNLNVNPYFDDYDEDKKFHRVLFKPRTPIQARELTQLQTILQKQIQRFGDHVFKDGSVVDGCHVTYRDGMKYVSVKNSFSANSDMTLSDVTTSHLLVGNTSGVRAVALTSKSGFEDNFPNSNRFYVNYIYSGNSASEFQRGEYVKVYSPDQDKMGVLNVGNYVDQIQVIDAVGATGNSYGVSVSDGVIYHKGFFEKVDAQTVVVKEFDTNPAGYRVGFDTEEEIVTEDQDESLTDNALGYPNATAPGAHRLKLSPVLVAKVRTDDSINKDFFAIVEFDGSNPTEQHTNPTYNALGDEFAIRTFEESGDYVAKPFSIETFPGIDANTGLDDANLFAYSISTGVAYVKGYRVEKIGTSNVVVERAFTETTSEAQVVTANYGNYVVLDEVVGHFDTRGMTEVTLYDAAQDTITDAEKASGARAGSIVGYAHLRALDFYTGTKGAPAAQWLAYLDNIRMNSGKSFALDVKSIYATSSYGDARGDVVLSTNFYANGSTYSYANLYDSSYKTLVFPVGVNAVKSLNDNTGASDTQFVFRDVANATLQTNGYISVTTNPAAAGGPERINASGTLTSLTEKLEFDVVLSTDVYTANLAGTVAVNTTSTNVVGTGTSFTSHFAEGAYVRVSTDSRRVTSVTNSTHMVVASPFSATNASANYLRHYLEGTHVDMSSASANVVISSNTTFAINSGLPLGGTVNATSTVRVSYPVLKHDAFPMNKDVRKSRWVKIDCSNNAAGSAGPWNLGLPDVYDVEAVYVGSTYSDTNTDGTAWFYLDNGQRDSHYDHARLLVNPKNKSSVTGAAKLLVKLSHLEANSSDGVGFFSVDSYPTSNTVSNTTVLWGEVPSFRSSDGTLYDLRDCVDYRPYKANTAASSTTEAGATINPAAAPTGFVSATYGYIPSPDTNFQADVAHYLPRRDAVTVNKNGDFAVVKGEPDANPRTPFVDDDVMLVATAYVPAWPTLTFREAEEYGRHDIRIRHDIKTNPRYTMRDIGSIDRRLKRMEYYTVLNAVEQKARDFSITDEDGLDRFKNGIFADPFNSHALGKVTDFEYKIAVDEREGVMRPFFTARPVDFKYQDDSATQRTGNYVTMPYTHEQFIVQAFASKYRNCTESVWGWNGKLTLYPSFDDHRDETRMPNVNVTLDLSSPWEDFASSPFGTNFGEWDTTGTNSAVTDRSLSSTTTTTTTTQDRIITEMQVDTVTNNYDLGSFVKDVSIEPFMRSRTVAFHCTNLKPNTVVHAFFDNVNVDAHCAPGDWSTVTEAEVGREDRIIERTGAYGSELKSDSSGTVTGVFRIPEGTFRVGDRVFMLVDVDDLITGDDAAVTRATARFSASNITLTTQNITLATMEPEITMAQSTQTQTLVSTSTSISTTPPQNRGLDPIAQSFFIPTDEEITGLFATKVDVFFRSKDPSLGVTVMVVETRLGTPDTSRVLVKSHLTSSEVNVSDDATLATTFVFEHPVFLSSRSVYAFLVKPDGDSPEYTIWLGETGGYDVTSGVQIYQNPYAGVAFVSSNMNTWSEIQKEDIKFILYRANFTTGSATAEFENEDDEFLTFSGLIRANTALSVQVGDLCYTANATNTLVGANTTQPYGVVQFIDEAEETVYIDTSTGGWSAGQVLQFHRPTALGNTSLINSNSLIATCNVVSVDDLSYHAVVPRFAVMTPDKTGINFEFAGTTEAGVKESAFRRTQNDVELEFRDVTRVVKSYSNEIDDLAGAASAEHKLTLYTTNEYVSPVIDLRRKSSLMVENLINDDHTGEANTRYGAASTKYVSRNVQLDDGQESEDIHVWVSAYRPSGTDFRVYVKFHCAEDGDVFDLKAWTELTRSSGEFTYSNTMDDRDYREFEFVMPTTAPAENPTAAFLPASGVLRYVRSDGAIYETYKTFSVKIVLLSSNPAVVPKLNDVRAICTQS